MKALGLAYMALLGSMGLGPQPGTQPEQPPAVSGEGGLPRRLLPAQGTHVPQQQQQQLQQLYLQHYQWDPVAEGEARIPSSSQADQGRGSRPVRARAAAGAIAMGGGEATPAATTVAASVQAPPLQSMWAYVNLFNTELGVLFRSYDAATGGGWECEWTRDVEATWTTCPRIKSDLATIIRLATVAVGWMFEDGQTTPNDALGACALAIGENPEIALAFKIHTEVNALHVIPGPYLHVAAIKEQQTAIHDGLLAYLDTIGLPAEDATRDFIDYLYVQLLDVEDPAPAPPSGAQDYPTYPAYMPEAPDKTLADEVRRRRRSSRRPAISAS